MGLEIGKVARRAGCSIATIRFYEEFRLIEPAVRSGGHDTALRKP